MKKPTIPFFSFLLLFLWTVPFSFDMATSVVPGWGTSVFPPHFILEILLAAFMLHATLGYWFLSRRGRQINWKLFVCHLVLSLPAILILKYPSILLDVQQPTQEDIANSIQLRLILVPVVWVFFFVGQAIFIIYCFRTIVAKRTNT